MVELIWDGKYRETPQGRQKVAPVRIALPFQTIETVNESAQDRQRSLELFAAGRETEWRNRLIWGDKKYVLPSLLPEFAGKVNLIYIDPPFDTGQDFSFRAIIPDHPDSPEDETTPFTKEPSILERKAYRDTWGVSSEERRRGMTSLDRYLNWISGSLILFAELLADTGALYVHLDWRLQPYVKPVLDEIFDFENFRNHIVWHYGQRTGMPEANFDRKHDDILFYAKPGHVLRETTVEWSREEFIEHRHDVLTDEEGREFIWTDGGPGKPRYKRYVQDVIAKGKPIDSVWEIPILNSSSKERTGYATQKPEELLERIIKASSSEGDLVLDCFVGSGTTAVVAERLNRRWIACDLGRFAIHTARKRLLSIPNVKPFVVQNLGKYERQEWQVGEFSFSEPRASASGPLDSKSDLARSLTVAARTSATISDRVEEQRLRERAYRKFILDLYHATAVTGYTWLHGVKAGRMVHVGAVDAPVTLADVKAICREVWKAAGTGKNAPAKAAVDILGWEFAFEINELAKQVAAESRVDVSFKKIPREVLDKKAVEQGDVQFFELGALSVDVKQKSQEVTLKLKDFVIPLDDVPEDVRKAIKHWSQMIDYWAVDWDYKGDTFHNQWQSYRTRKEPNRLELETAHTYPEPGKYRIVVKVIDLLGNDTTKTLEIEV